MAQEMIEITRYPQNIGDTTYAYKGHDPRSTVALVRVVDITDSHIVVDSQDRIGQEGLPANAIGQYSVGANSPIYDVSGLRRWLLLEKQNHEHNQRAYAEGREQDMIPAYPVYIREAGR